MPEHDETDAPEPPPGSDLTDAEDEFWAEVAEKRRKSKLERWGVEYKVVDGESK